MSSSFSDFLPSSLKIAPENCLNCIACEMCKRIFVQKRTCDVKQAISPKIWSSTGTQKFTCKAFERKCPSGRRTAKYLLFSSNWTTTEPHQKQKRKRHRPFLVCDSVLPMFCKKRTPLCTGAACLCLCRSHGGGKATLLLVARATLGCK